MWKSWKTEIIGAIKLVIVVAIVAVLVNWIRTPILLRAAEQGTISHARARITRGVNLIDPWRHKGWPEVGVQPVDGSPGPGPGPTQPDSQIWTIDVFKAKELFDAGDCIFFDARGAQYYEEGHIAGANNWPFDMFDSYHSQYADTVADADCIVAYCSGGSCDESNTLAVSLFAEGYREIYLFEGGMEAWEYMGYPTNVGSEP